MDARLNDDTKILLWSVGGLLALYLLSRTDTGDALLSSGVNTVESTIRGIRNNNPGNIRISGNAWIGKVPLDKNTDGTFEQFDTMAHGIRALAKNLKSYQSNYGLNTPDAIIRRWSATDQDPYVANVAAALGVDSHDSIDLSDTETLRTVVSAIIKQENGLAGYALAAAFVNDGVAAA